MLLFNSEAGECKGKAKGWVGREVGILDCIIANVWMVQPLVGA